MNRFSATSSAGGKPGRPFGVFDRTARRVVSHHRTAAEAIAATRNLNRDTPEQIERLVANA